MIVAVTFPDCTTARANPLRINLSCASIGDTGPLMEFGTSSRPGGVDRISVNRVSLLRDGVPWIAPMGEFHFSRYPQDEWRDELLKMKSGGIEIVATYIFWIHHEEVRGEYDWTGGRDLRHFIRLCKELDLPLVLRIGPWAHGEVRNGGLPEWLLDQPGVKLRSDDPAYLAHVKAFYAQIGRQSEGLLWKDGGPVIGVQLENEFWGHPQHLITLKHLAREAGLDVPFYTRTGWPELAAPMPLGEMLPLHGGYAEGFWDRDLVSMPGNYWRDFRFSHEREAASVATDHFGQFELNDEDEAKHYPYFTCETGGGMMTSYHRRIAIDPRDIITVALVKIGSGSNLPGYYMYHGGVNPESKTGITLNERQATRNTNYNDLPVKSYDFQAPLGEAGQIRPHYHLLRRLHTFVREFSTDLAMMASVLPEVRPSGKDDIQTLRWAARSNGHSGFVFVSNFQRGTEMPAKREVRFHLDLSGGRSLQWPASAITFPANSICIWPFNLALGSDLTLAWATAQPICRLEDTGIHYTFFSRTTGVPGEFAFDGDDLEVIGSPVERRAGRTIIRDVVADVPIRVRSRSGSEHVIVVLDEERSLSLYKLKCAGRERVILSRAAVLQDGDALRLQASNADDLSISVFPPFESVQTESVEARGSDDGLFRRYTPVVSRVQKPAVKVERTREADPTRMIPLGQAGVAEQPSDSDFERAAVYRIRFPDGIDPSSRLTLRVHYVGDVARFCVGDTLVTDNFYNGTPFDLALWRCAFGSRTPEVHLKVLPLRKDAPIYLQESAWPRFGDGMATHEAILGVEVIEQFEVRLAVR